LRPPEKENPAVGTPGQTFFVIGVYGFKYAAWLVLVALEGAEQVVFFVQPISFLVLLLSCSSTTFSNLTEPSATSQRFLLVCALTCPSRGRAVLSKTYATGRLTRGISVLTRQAG
jgi:hypothetical protein